MNWKKRQPRFFWLFNFWLSFFLFSTALQVSLVVYSSLFSHGAIEMHLERDSNGSGNEQAGNRVIRAGRKLTTDFPPKRYRPSSTRIFQVQPKIIIIKKKRFNAGRKQDKASGMMEQADLGFYLWFPSGLWLFSVPSRRWPSYWAPDSSQALGRQRKRQSGENLASSRRAYLIRKKITSYPSCHNATTFFGLNQTILLLPVTFFFKLCFFLTWTFQSGLCKSSLNISRAIYPSRQEIK